MRSLNGKGLNPEVEQIWSRGDLVGVRASTANPKAGTQLQSMTTSIVDPM